MEPVAFIAERESEHSWEQRSYCSTLNFKMECLKSLRGTIVRKPNTCQDRGFSWDFKSWPLSIKDQVRINGHRLWLSATENKRMIDDWILIYYPQRKQPSNHIGKEKDLKWTKLENGYHGCLMVSPLLELTSRGGCDRNIQVTSTASLQGLIVLLFPKYNH